MELAIHADRTHTVVVAGAAQIWIASPEPGVERRMLERVGGEVALATSIVRYAAGARFAAHSHALGEEFLVLDGVFCDEGGEYPAGTYVRNPPGSRHAPFSVGGCVIFVKLRQMLADEPEAVRVRPEQRNWHELKRGVECAQLYGNGRVQVELLRLAPGAWLPPRTIAGGEELFVFSGAVELEETPTRELPAWPWRRSAESAQPGLRARSRALLWAKRGHL